MKLCLRSIAPFALFPLLGCSSAPAVDEAVAQSASSPIEVAQVAPCGTLPAAFANQPAYRFPTYSGSGGALLLGPAHPKPGDELFVVYQGVLPYRSESATVRMTSDAWKTQADRPMTQYCDNGSSGRVFGLSLGQFSDGAAVELAVNHKTDDYGSEWWNNGGTNYRIEVHTPGPLAWLGDTHLRFDGVYVPSDMVTGGRALSVYTQSYPAGAAKGLKLYWADERYGAVKSADMALDAEGVGPSGKNAQHRATIPTSDVVTGHALHYWVRAEDFGGKVLWDSRDGANYDVVPRAFSVGWIGGFGSAHGYELSYGEGGLMNADGSTSTGCNNHGASLSSYSARAVRVYIPGLTDRAYADDAQLAAAKNLVRVEAYSNLTPGGGWRSFKADFARRTGNDFVYRYFHFMDYCVGGGENPLADGLYAYKLRVSTDGGATWAWRGTEQVPGGGENLPIAYGGRCSYFNDPFDCVPDETTLTRSFAGEPGASSIGTIKLDTGARLGTATASRTLNNATGAEQTLRNVRLEGPNAALFALKLVDADTGKTIPSTGTVRITVGQKLRFEATYTPKQPSGSLPHMASVLWDETTYAPPGTSKVHALYLRGMTRP